ncbi:hypothetical protein KO488_12320 [Poseidonibacter lekithochrous]|uniref:hypothetical protein n=1 Tax=Poseidonibacter TaxID=2321187 RepID=UPI001C0A000F|nr:MULTISPECIES: hypothetical protein [Poseidonibacter]MBU3015545.1 hypothetical protein [Poseidonibacter lekithochrous]MDO6828844.1 hypothetical protein [Poseidonibacter sp. 1_MG-2023]
MKLRKILAMLTIAGALSLFADGISNVDALVDQINKTTDVKEKSALMKKLNTELSVMDKKDVSKAKEIIDSKLKINSK